MTQHLREALVLSLEALENLRLKYALVGGLAVGAWGVSRSTRDVDLYAELPDSKRAPLQEALEQRGFHVPAMAQELSQFGVFRSRSRQGVFVDIFDAVGPLGEVILQRRREVMAFDRSVWLIGAEELILLKAFSDRPRDHEDLLNLTHVTKGQLDIKHMESWARRLDESTGGREVSERLTEALAKSTGRH